MTDFSSTISPTPQQNKSRGSRHAPGVPQPAVVSKRIGQSSYGKHKEPSEAKKSSRGKKKGTKINISDYPIATNNDDIISKSQQDKDSCRKIKRERDED